MDLTFAEKPAGDIRLPETTGVTSQHASKLRLPRESVRAQGTPAAAGTSSQGRRSTEYRAHGRLGSLGSRPDTRSMGPRKQTEQNQGSDISTLQTSKGPGLSTRGTHSL